MLILLALVFSLSSFPEFLQDGSVFVLKTEQVGPKYIQYLGEFLKCSF
jgi:hypothetical protein